MQADEVVGAAFFGSENGLISMRCDGMHEMACMTRCANGSFRLFCIPRGGSDVDVPPCANGGLFRSWSFVGHELLR